MRNAEGALGGQLVALCGNVCAGKTTLAGILSDVGSWSTLFEPDAENRYLSQFHENPAHFAFHTQVEFLLHRTAQYRTHLERDGRASLVISDRSIDDDINVFVPLLYEAGLLAEREVETMMDLFSLMSLTVPRPIAVIYLDAPVETLRRRAQQRGASDSQIGHKQLMAISRHYENWIATLCVPVMRLDTGKMDLRVAPGSILDEIRQFIADAIA